MLEELQTVRHYMLTLISSLEGMGEPRFEQGEDLHDESLSGLRVYRAAIEKVLAAGRCDQGINECYEAVLDELDRRGEL